MFGNIPYFIIVLLVYATYQPPEIQPLPGGEAVLLFGIITGAFAAITWVTFRRHHRQVTLGNRMAHDARLEIITTRQTVMAVVVFAVSVYGLGLPTLTRKIPLLTAVPTLEALIFLAIFVGYLVIIWTCAHQPYQGPGHDRMTTRKHITANLSFSLPVLLPWVLLSSAADIINLLPFSGLQAILASPLGQVAFFLVFLLVVALFGPVLIQRCWGCRPLEKSPVRERIEAFCRLAGVKYADILSWPLFGGRILTAGVMGLAARFRYILITPALIRFLTPVELDAVMAHEIGHIKKKHLFFYLFFFISLMPTIFLSYALLGQMIHFTIIYFTPLYQAVGSSGLRWISQNSGINSAIIIIMYYLYFRYVFGYFMRNFERQADIYAYTLTHTATPLITSLKKIAIVSGQSPEKPNWHHFSIRERIDYLSECEADPHWIRRHEAKLRYSLITYVIGMVLVAGIYYQMAYGRPGEKINAYFLETLLLREIEAAPDNPELYGELGDFYHIWLKKYPEAITAYERSISLAPATPEVLNNLAWLYATCEDETVRRPERALALALRAADIKPADYILDTLAECYFINGDIERAVVNARRAVTASDARNRTHFERQLKRFEAMLE